jgi:hypothetical protein
MALSGSAMSAAVKALAVDLAHDATFGVDQRDLVHVIEAGRGGDVAEAKVPWSRRRRWRPPD